MRKVDRRVRVESHYPRMVSGRVNHPLATCLQRSARIAIRAHGDRYPTWPMDVGLGIGRWGHIAVLYAIAMGHRVVAVDVDDSKLELARQHGPR